MPSCPLMSNVPPIFSTLRRTLFKPIPCNRPSSSDDFVKSICPEAVWLQIFMHRLFFTI